MGMQMSADPSRSDVCSESQFTTLLNSSATFSRLWRKALPYLDTRQNEIHTRLCVGLALHLLDQEGGEPAVVIPAVILHDVGWKRVPVEMQARAFGPKATAPELNRIHEVEGVKIAQAVLTEVGMDAKWIPEILTIIDGHDSRIEAVSQNDGLVKDADKLWRYTQEGLSIDIERFGETYSEGLQRLRENRLRWFLTATGRQTAQDLLHRRESARPPC
jgi:HD superfamily phosphodiesterase